MKTAVIVNDFTTCEEIALGIQMPILRDMGHKVLPVPTKILSYPLYAEDAAVLETEEFAKKMFDSFLNGKEEIDAVLTGFIPNPELIRETKEFCEKQKSKGAYIYVDPVFADNGKIYKSVSPENIEALRDLLSAADMSFPNYTEACILTGMDFSGENADPNCTVEKTGITNTEAQRMLRGLQMLGTKVPVVTGCVVDGRDTIIYLDESNNLCTVGYDRVDAYIAGTGDRFAVGVVGRLLDGKKLGAAIGETAAEITERIRNRSI